LYGFLPFDSSFDSNPDFEREKGFIFGACSENASQNRQKARSPYHTTNIRLTKALTRPCHNCQKSIFGGYTTYWALDGHEGESGSYTSAPFRALTGAVV